MLSDGVSDVRGGAKLFSTDLLHVSEDIVDFTDRGVLDEVFNYLVVVSTHDVLIN